MLDHITEGSGEQLGTLSANLGGNVGGGKQLQNTEQDAEGVGDWRDRRGWCRCGESILVGHSALKHLRFFPLGLCDDCFRNGDRQERRSVRVSVHSVFIGHVLSGLDTLFTMISRRVWKVNEYTGSVVNI